MGRTGWWSSNKSIESTYDDSVYDDCSTIHTEAVPLDPMPLCVMEDFGFIQDPNGKRRFDYEGFKEDVQVFFVERNSVCSDDDLDESVETWSTIHSLRFPWNRRADKMKQTEKSGKRNIPFFKRRNIKQSRHHTTELLGENEENDPMKLTKILHPVLEELDQGNTTEKPWCKPSLQCIGSNTAFCPTMKLERNDSDDSERDLTMLESGDQEVESVLTEKTDQSVRLKKWPSPRNFRYKPNNKLTKNTDSVQSNAPSRRLQSLPSNDVVLSTDNSVIASKCTPVPVDWEKFYRNASQDSSENGIFSRTKRQSQYGGSDDPLDLESSSSHSSKNTSSSRHFLLKPNSQGTRKDKLSFSYKDKLSFSYFKSSRGKKRNTKNYTINTESSKEMKTSRMAKDAKRSRSSMANDAKRSRISSTEASSISNSMIVASITNTGKSVRHKVSLKSGLK